MSFYPIGYRSPISPPRPFHPFHGICHGSVCNRSTGIGSRRSCNFQRIAGFILFLHFIENHLKSRSFVFFHPNIQYSIFSLESVNASLSSFRQSKGTAEGTELIGFYCHRTDFLPICIEQHNAHILSCYRMYRITKLFIDQSRILDCLARTVDSPVGKQIDMRLFLIIFGITIPLPRSLFYRYNGFPLGSSTELIHHKSFPLVSR